MKIRKVDDKPMVIHTKEKAKIHAHEPKGAKIKGSNIYTVERGPKTIGAKVSDDKKKSYRKSTIHQSEAKNKGLSRFKRNYRESNTSIKTKKPTKDNTTIGVSWEHGIYLGSTLSTTNFKAYKREYGTPEKIEDIYDYRAKLKQKFYFYQDMSKDDDVPKKLQNDFLHQMYEDFGTIEEDCFYDRLEDGKYDEGFKERQVKEEKSR